MNSTPDKEVTTHDILDALESEAIGILRDAAAAFIRPVAVTA